MPLSTVIPISLSKKEESSGCDCKYYQDSDSITQSELMRMMNDNSKDEEIQADNYSSYILTESVHRPRHAQDMWSSCMN